MAKLFFYCDIHKVLFKKKHIIFCASFQFSLFTQYLILGGVMLPCMSPAFFSSLRCCDTVDWASGISFTISPQMQLFLLSKSCIMAMRAGCPRALQKPAMRKASSV